MSCRDAKKRVDHHRVGNECVADPSGEVVAGGKCYPRSDNTGEDEVEPLQRKQGTEQIGWPVDRGEEDAVIGDARPKPHQRKSKRDHPVGPARFRTNERDGHRTNQIGNDLRWPNRGVIGGEDCKELFDGERKHGRTVFVRFFVCFLNSWARAGFH